MSNMVKLVLKQAAVLLLLAWVLGAQTQTGGISGTVSDLSGAVVPGASLSLTNLDTNEPRSYTSNEIGVFTFPAVEPGRYRLEVQHSGFKRFVQGPIEVRVQQFVTVNPVLQIGEAAQSVEVTGEVALLDPATSSLSHVVENRQVNELPLNGRNTLALVELTPGIRSQGQFNQHIATRSYAGWGNFSSNGGISNANDVLVDGASVGMFLMNSPSLIPPVDATQEFRVQTNNYSAEFDRSAGAVINIGIKAGTNRLHGSAYEFLRNSTLDANDFFQNRAGQKRPALTYNQYGFGVGGPVLLPKYNGRDRTFFFGNFEGFRQRQAKSVTTTVPTALQMAGDFSQTFNAAGQLVQIGDPAALHPMANGTQMRDSFPGNKIPAGRFDPVADKLRVNGRVWALPNVPGQPFTGVDNFSTSATQPSNEDQVVTRIDHTLNAKWKLFGTYAAQTFTLGGWDPFRNGTDLLEVGGNESNLTQTAVLGATALFSARLVGEFRSSYSRFRNNRIPPSDGFDLTSVGFPASLAALQQVKSFPRLQFSGVQNLGKLSTSQIRRILNGWNQSGSLTWMRGAHAFKFGAQYRVHQGNDFQLDNSSGAFTFDQRFTSTDPLRSTSTSGNTAASFLLGLPASGSMGLSERLALERQYSGFFFHDDWKVTRKLTLNLGLRYSLEFGPTDRFNRQTWFDFGAIAPIVQQAGLSSRGALQFTDDKTRTPKDVYLRQWAPRFGFAYQALSKTVVRGGYGIFWLPAGLETSGTSDRNPTANVSTAFVSSLDNGITPQDKLSNPFPNGLIPLLGRTQGMDTLIGQSVSVFVRGEHVGYTQQWNFNIQQEIRSGLAVDIAYAGSKGTGLPATIQANQLPNELLTLGTGLNQQAPNPFFGRVKVGTLAQPTVARSQLLRPYPQFTGVGLTAINVGSSIYHSMQMKVTRRFSRSLIAAAYTLSKGIGDTEAVVDWLEASGTPSSFTDSNNRRSNRSINAFDAPQRLVVYYTLELPFGKGNRWCSDLGKAGALISGWELNGIYTAQSGTPLFLGTATNLTNSQGGGSRPNNSGQSAALSGNAHDRLNRWFDTSVFSQPAAFTFGNTSRTLPDVRNHGTNNVDFGLLKNNRFGQDGRLNLQFRSEFFNLFNRVRFRDPGLTFGNPQFGIVNSQVNSPRMIQAALKLLF